MRDVPIVAHYAGVPLAVRMPCPSLLALVADIAVFAKPGVLNGHFLLVWEKALKGRVIQKRALGQNLGSRGEKIHLEENTCPVMTTRWVLWAPVQSRYCSMLTQ